MNRTLFTDAKCNMKTILEFQIYVQRIDNIYFVHWLGYPLVDGTCESVKNLMDIYPNFRLMIEI